MVLNTIREADLKGKRVLIRVDFNVPLKDGAVTDNTRIKAALPTIKYILDNGASLVVMTHLGRPKGEKNEKYSLAPVAAEFSKLLGKDVKLASDVIGDEVKKEVEAWLDERTDLRGCTCDTELYFTFGSGLLPSGNSFLSAIMEEAGQEKAEVFPAGCEQGIMLSAGYEAAVLGPGSIKDAHMPDEKVRVSDLGKAYELYRKIISRILM